MTNSQIPDQLKEKYEQVMGWENSSSTEKQESKIYKNTSKGIRFALKLLTLNFGFLARKVYFPLPHLLQRIFKRTRIAVRYSTIVTLVVVLTLGPLAYIRLRKPQSAEAAWFDDNWLYRKKIEITNSGSAQTDFQVQILNNFDMSLDVTNGKVQSDFDDLRFTDIHGKLLPYWIEDNTSSSLDVWAKVPSVPTSGATVYLYYGNPSVSSESSTTNTFIREIDNVQGAWKMDESSWGTPNCSDEVVLDSSGNSNDGKACPNTTGPDGGDTGKFGNGGLFDGDDDYVITNTISDLPSGNNARTIVFWMKADDVTPNTAISMVGYGQNTQGKLFMISIGINTNKLFLWGSTNNYQSNHTVNTGIWYHVAVTLDGSDIEFYKNGVGDGGGTVTLNTNITGNYGKVRIGFDSVSGLFDHFSGTIDGVRIYNDVLTSDEISDLYGTGGNRHGYVTTNYANKELVRKYDSGVSVGAPSENEEQAPGPVAYWKFDEGYGDTTYDSTQNKNNGTRGGGTADYKPTWQSEDMCISGKCFYFDGTDDYVDAGNNSSLNFSNFSFSVWAKWNTGAGSSVDKLLDKTNSAGSAGWSFRVSNANKIGLWDPTNSWTESNTLSWSNNLWYHLAVTYDGSTLAFYKDGVDVGSSSVSLGTITSTTNLKIGGANLDISPQPFHGFIDEVKIYPYARSAAQVKADFLRGAAGHGSSVVLGAEDTSFLNDGLVGYWKMDEATGSAVADSSGNDNSGALTDAQETGIAETESITTTVVDADNADLSSTDDVYNNMILAITGGDSCGVTTGIERTISDYTGSTKIITVSPAFSAEPDDCGFIIKHQVGGKFGNGVGFGDNDYANVPYNASLVSQSITLAAWAKASSFPEQAHGIITSKSVANYGINLEMRSGWIAALVGDGSSWEYVETTWAPQTGVWYHIAVTHDSESNLNRLYVNGKLEKTETKALNYSASQVTQIGKFYTGTSALCFRGLIDEARVYNRALSPAEVRALYNWAPGPVMHLKMDEKISGDSQTLYDTSTYGNNGTTNDGAGNTGMDCRVPGKFGSGCEFDGSDDYVDLDSYIDTFKNYSAGTIEAWVNTSDLILNRPIIAMSDASTNNNVLWVTIDTDDKLYILVKHSSGDVLRVTTTSAINSQSNWIHIVYKTDSNGNSVYINGVSVPMTYTSGNSSTQAFFSHAEAGSGNCDKLTIGSAWYAAAAPARYFKGQIDDVQIYNYARTSKQIVEDMNAGHPAVGSPVGSAVGYWKFDEGYGTTAYDSGTGGNNGTLTNGPTWSNSGKLGKAVNFTGDDDFVVCSSNTDLRIDSDLTVTAWIKPDTVGDAEYIITHGTSGEGAADNYLYLIRWDTTSGNDIDYLHEYGTGSDEINIFDTNLSTLTWYHLAVVRNATAKTVKVYIDGVQKDSTFTYTNAPSGGSSGVFTVGGRDNGNNPYDGLIDEVKIYSSALTEDEVRLDYNQGKAIVMGAVGTDSSGNPSWSSDRSYCPPGDTTSDCGPVAEWSFDEGSGGTVNDRSGNGNTGTWGGTGTTHWATGKIGKAGKFTRTDGDNVNVGTGSTLDPTSQITVEAWVKPSSLGTIRTIVNRHTDNNNAGGSIRLDASNKFETILGLSVSGGGTVTSNSTVTDTTRWHHLALTYDGSNKKLYINGYLDKNQPGSGDIVWNNNSNFISHPSSSVSFDGLIDHVQIYDYARTQAQIAWDYNRGKPVGHWKFDECQGDTTYDSSGNSNNGMITIESLGSQSSLGTCTASAATAWYNGRNGKYNYSLNFDGTDDNVQITDVNDDYDFDGDLSYGAWFKTSNSGSSTTILSRGTTNDWQYGMFKSSSDQFWCKVYQANSGNAYLETIVAQTINDNNWHQGTCVASGTTLYAYIDGVLVATDNTPSGTRDTASSGEFYIGKFDQGAITYPFPGQIDDIRIYNYALTEQQIKQVFNEGSAIRFGPSTGSP